MEKPRNLGILNDSIFRAYKRGYRVIDGDVISPVSGNKLKTYPNAGGYLQFSIQIGPVRFNNVLVHKLVAYQKYGKRLFNKGVVVRHIDGDKTNNRKENIRIGSIRDNSLDIPAETRKRISHYAAGKHRKFTDEEIEQIKSRYNELRSYVKVMKEFNISTKSLLHRILHTDYIVKKED